MLNRRKRSILKKMNIFKNVATIIFLWYYRTYSLPHLYHELAFVHGHLRPGRGASIKDVRITSGFLTPPHVRIRLPAPPCPNEVFNQSIYDLTLTLYLVTCHGLPRS